MRVVMVKKRLANGEACKKCQQAEDLLRNRGLWERIDEVVWALEDDPESEGIRLARQHGIDLAPFFIVRDDHGERIYDSVLKLIRERLTDAPGAPAGSLDVDAIAKLGAEYSERTPEETIRWGLERFGAECAIAFSGAEDVALIDMAHKTKLPFSVFCLDTGRLHPETYAFIETVRKHYGIEISLMNPDAIPLQDLVRKKGLFSFYEDGHGECCGIRKVEPLKRALKGYRAWITGQRRDQSPATRSDVAAIEIDGNFAGKDGPLVKLNPLARVSSAKVWEYITDNQVPYNPLHSKGFRSIGCEPCTRATLPNEHERAGRWWWEETTKRECGLHLK